jgi:polysaccharide pyruvyl transferase WcaK-like protein
MKILQISSFKGNIGDNMSHIGLNYLLNDLKIVHTISKLEIRKTYENYNNSDKIKLNSDLSSKISEEFDVLVIGGGSFLEYRDTQSQFRIDFTPGFMKNLTSKLLFTSIGFAPRHKNTKNSVDALQNLVKLHNNCDVCVRNDGSWHWAQKNINDLNKFHPVIDNALFININDFMPQKYKNEIAINVGYDQLKEQGPKYYKNKISSLSYLVHSLITKTKFKINFIPHTPTDYFAISDIMSKLPDWQLRSRIHISSLVPGDEGAIEAIKQYLASSGIVSMRFHSNIIAAMSEKPHLSIGVLPRVKNLLESLKSEYISTDLSTEKDIDRSLEAFISVLNQKDLTKNKEHLEKLKNQSYKTYMDLLLSEKDI